MPNVSRRRYIAGMTAAGVPIVAGCLGDDDDDDTAPSADDDDDPVADDSDPADDSDQEPTTIRLVSTAEGGSIFPAAQGLAAAINEESDEIRVDGRPSDGSDANMGLLAREETDIGMATLWTWRNLRENNPPFDELDVEIQQISHFLALNLFFVTLEETGWETMYDMEPGSSLFPAPVGSGTAQYAQFALDNHIEDDYEVVPTGLAGAPSALAEGRIDLTLAAGLNNAGVAANVHEMGAAADCRVMEWPVEDMEHDDNLAFSETDPDLFRDLDGFVHVPDPLFSLDLTECWVCREGYDYDAIYEFVRAKYDAREELQQYHGLLASFEDPAHMVHAPFPDLPFHPAAADFYEEVGLWDDETMIRGE